MIGQYFDGCWKDALRTPTHVLIDQVSFVTRQWSSLAVEKDQNKVGISNIRS